MELDGSESLGSVVLGFYSPQDGATGKSRSVVLSQMLGGLFFFFIFSVVMKMLHMAAKQIKGDMAFYTASYPAVHARVAFLWGPPPIQIPAGKPGFLCPLSGLAEGAW